ncbi:MAG TPA: hypothetical protein VGI29_12920 [Candidatus Binataceae bacterium]
MVAQPALAPKSEYRSLGAASGGIAAAAPGGAAVGAAAGAVGGGFGAPVAGTSSSSSSFVIISAPGRSVSWRIGKNGTVLRRDANGAMRTQNSGVTTDLVAGAAPSATVCWIVGRSGTIIRTTDGEDWTLITAPTADNLDAVTASNAYDASITTAGGQRFVTSDGGISWHPQ